MALAVSRCLFFRNDRVSLSFRRRCSFSTTASIHKKRTLKLSSNCWVDRPLSRSVLFRSTNSVRYVRRSVIRFFDRSFALFIRIVDAFVMDEIEVIDSIESLTNFNASVATSNQQVATDVSSVGGDSTCVRSSVCCGCSSCSCACHAEKLFNNPESMRPVDSYVAYLFDHGLFDVPNNRDHFEILIDYLRSEGIFSRSYVVTVANDQARDPFTGSSGRNSLDCDVVRSRENNDVLKYAPSIVQSVDSSRSDVRRYFTGLYAMGADSDWFTVKSSINFPSYTVYVHVARTKNRIPADYSILVDYGANEFCKTPGTYGLKIAKILTFLRHKYFDIPMCDFGPLLEDARIRSLARNIDDRRGRFASLRERSIDGARRFERTSKNCSALVQVNENSMGDDSRTSKNIATKKDVLEIDSNRRDGNNFDVLYR